MSVAWLPASRKSRYSLAPIVSIFKKAENGVARGVSIAQACRAFAIRQRRCQYAPLLADEYEEIKDWLAVKKIQPIAFSHLKRIKSERK
jgi:hypothetical protein